MPTEEQLLEIHRLAVRGQSAAIAQDVATRLTGHWLGLSRFREVRALSLLTLSLGPHAGTMVHLARAKHSLGEVQEALTLYHDAMQLYDAVGDRTGLATTLSNLGAVHDGLGQPEQALAYFQQALPIQEAVGDRAGESVTRYNTAMLTGLRASSRRRWRRYAGWWPWTSRRSTLTSRPTGRCCMTWSRNGRHMGHEVSLSDLPEMNSHGKINTEGSS